MPWNGAGLSKWKKGGQIGILRANQDKLLGEGTMVVIGMYIYHMVKIFIIMTSTLLIHFLCCGICLGNPKWVSNERIDDEKDYIQLKDLLDFIQASKRKNCTPTELVNTMLETMELSKQW